jgi:lipoprotein-anchoring transpeptidase ErfK/SrfK
MRAWPLLFVLGCGGSAPLEQPLTEPVVSPPTPASKSVTVALTIALEPLATVYPDAIHSVRFTRTTALRKQPRGDADRVGIISKDTRAGVLDEAPASDGCSRWIEIAPRGWTCETAIEPSEDQPTAATVVSFADEATDVVPGVYGFVHGENVQAYASAAEISADEGRVLTGANSVRAAGVVTVDGRRFWQTSEGSLIDESAIVRVSPSNFKGVAIDDALPAWVRGRDARKPVATHDAPGGKVTGSLAPRTVVTILEEASGFARIADDTWVARGNLRAATRTTPPAGTGATEKWFDVDLDDQVLVAYEGDKPVYATLVSTGKSGHETPASISRVSEKLLTAVMNNAKGERYSVADVPWTMYYDHDFALHTSYWHDGFGGVRSHGCVNLAPRDARILYQWSSPDVPPGWIAVFGDADNPGSLVRVHSHAVPEPVFRGYARDLVAVNSQGPAWPDRAAPPKGSAE